MNDVIYNGLWMLAAFVWGMYAGIRLDRYMDKRAGGGKA